MPGADARWRGINFGRALDTGLAAGDTWLRERHFDVVRAAGLDTVRVPVKWSAHQAAEPPWRVADGFFDRVDCAIDAALRRELNVVLDVHHFDDLSADVDRHRDPFLALWAQIAERYADRGPRLCFELLNEPHDPMTADTWNALLVDALGVVRAVDATRTVIVGPVRWNIVDALPTLRLPDDERLVVTVHYYSPFRFTHQGAHWLDGADGWLGTSWGSDAERARVRADLEAAAAWAREQGRPLFVGEFGAIDKAGTAARAAWTAHVRSEADRLGLSWAYWSFASDFGAFDLERDAWRAPLVEALLGAP
jgi:endoglucanase